MEWTDESIARLRALWQEGLSTAEIGRRMGITKNAVVGKAHRLDLAARPSPIRKTEARPVPSVARPAPAPVAAPAAVPVVAQLPARPAAATVAASPAAVAPAKIVAVAKPPAERPAEASEPSAASDTVASAAPDNVRLLRPERPNPVLSPAPRPEPIAERVEPAPERVEPVAEKPERPRAAVRTAEPREPRRRGLSCCWPLGEPGTKGFHFCGADPAPGKPYCAEHAALAYVKLRDRRDSVA